MHVVELRRFGTPALGWHWCLCISASMGDVEVGYRARLSASLALAGAVLAGCIPTPPVRNEMADASRQAQDEVNGATGTVDRMQADPAMALLLRSAKGVLVVPDYGKGAYFLGGQGGRGVLLLRGSGGEWSEPAFYLLGGTGIGLNGGGTAQPVAMVLMTLNAVSRFRDNTSTWQLGADSALTVANFPGRQTKTGGNPKADIIMWSGTNGVYGGLAGRTTYITPDGGLNFSYYQRVVTNQQILSAAVGNIHTAGLREALAGRTGATYR